MKWIVLVISVNPLSIKKKREKLDQLLLNSGHGDHEQRFTKPDQRATQIDKRNQVPVSMFFIDLTKRGCNLLKKA